MLCGGGNPARSVKAGSSRVWQYTSVTTYSDRHAGRPKKRSPNVGLRLNKSNYHERFSDFPELRKMPDKSPLYIAKANALVRHYLSKRNVLRCGEPVDQQGVAFDTQVRGNERQVRCIRQPVGFRALRER